MTEVPADDLAYALELIQNYCDDLCAGKYTLQPGENPIIRIQGVAGLGLQGMLKRENEVAQSGGS